MTGDVADLIPSTEPVARERAERIRRGIHNYLETLAEIALAWERRDWEILGYAGWQAYVDGEFGAARLKLPVEHRQKAVQELRFAGMSQRTIAGTLGVNRETVIKDIREVVGNQPPEEIRGADGKTYAATRPAPAAPPPAGERGPAPGEQVWIATARKGIAGHALKSKTVTRCGRATRTGLTLTARQAAERWETVWCRPCWPEQETTLTNPHTAAGASTDPADGADTATPSAGHAAPASLPSPPLPAGDGREVTPETAAAVACTDPADGADTATPDAGDAAPAPAPPPTSGSGGAGVTTCCGDEATSLTLAEIRALRAAFDWARGGLARHPRSGARGLPRVLGRAYVPGESTPPVAPVFDQGVTHVEVRWAPIDCELSITYRSDRYVIDEYGVPVASVHQALDVLCALGVLPARISRQYAAGVQAGMRAGDAIDGECFGTATDG